MFYLRKIFIILVSFTIVSLSANIIVDGTENKFNEIDSIGLNISDIPELKFEVEKSNVSLGEKAKIILSISNNNQNIDYVDLYLVNTDNDYQYVISVRLLSTSELTFEGYLDILNHREPGFYDVHSMHMYGSEKVLVVTSDKYADSYPYGEVRNLAKDLFSITGTYGYYIPNYNIENINRTYEKSESINTTLTVSSDILNYEYAMMEFGLRKDGYRTTFSLKLEEIGTDTFYGEEVMYSELNSGYYDLISISFISSEYSSSIYSKRYNEYKNLNISKTVDLDEYSFTLLNNIEGKISYRTHVQSIGWQDYVVDGEMSGTTGLAKRLEGIEIIANGNQNLGVKYSTHVEKYGWLDYVENGEMSGTSGRALRLEAIKIELIGSDAYLYDIFYRVHAESFGWLDWAKNGLASGTAGYARRLEGIEIIIVKKGDNPGFETSEPYRVKNGIKNVIYSTHIQSKGWQSEKADGTMSGTQGEGLRLEGVKIRLGDHFPSGSIMYNTHVEKIGWMNPVVDNEISGTTGKALRLEAIRIQLNGEIADQYDVYYRVHTQRLGWLGWAKNGQDSGTAGYAYRLEGLEIKVLPKGSKAPGSTVNRFFSIGN